jgi:IS5 family transposase
MLGMFMLKHTYKLSDEQVWDRWVHDPYFQYFTGEEYFQHALPHERSGMCHWRKRIGERLDILVAESLRVAHDTGALTKDDLGSGRVPGRGVGGGHWRLCEAGPCHAAGMASGVEE